jgi:RND family efflux transporter MFP subunit
MVLYRGSEDWPRNASPSQGFREFKEDDMNEKTKITELGLTSGNPSLRVTKRIVSGLALLVAIAILAYWATTSFASRGSITARPAAPPSVAVSVPLQRDLSTQLGFLGQFSAVERVELRGQVGGTLTEIHFKDGDFIKKGALLFVIDPIPYAIKVSEATAELESARARFELATRELKRAETLKTADAGSAENVEQRAAEKDRAQAAVDNASALVRDARFDLDHCRISAPFSGQIGSHMVSVGNLVSGSRGGSSPTTLLTTLVSVDPIYLEFDMSEADYMTYQRERIKHGGSAANKVSVSLSDEANFTRQGVLDFVDNTLDRSSGTIRARATVRNEDLMLTPGGFARVRLGVTTPSAVLLVPDAAVLSDQSDHAVLILDKNNVVRQQKVEVGDLRGGLRVIRAGLKPTDQVIIDGIPSATPGTPVSPQAGLIKFGSDQE